MRSRIDHIRVLVTGLELAWNGGLEWRNTTKWGSKPFAFEKIDSPHLPLALVAS